MNEVSFYEDLSPLLDKNLSRGQLGAKEVIIKLNGFAFGDTVCATPTIRKMAQSYQKKMIVSSRKPFLFEHNPYVKFHINLDDFKDEYYNSYEVFDTFNSIGGPDKAGIEKKYSLYDIRKIHCNEIGFDLLPSELHCDYYPGPIEFDEEDAKFLKDSNYVVIHIGKNWPSRTYDFNKYKKLIKGLNDEGYPVALVGFDQSFEPGKYRHDKSCYDFQGFSFQGVSFINRTSLDQDFYITQNGEACITMDTGQLHLAGCTDTEIILIVSSVHPHWRLPYRNGSQEYKTTCVYGECTVFCASDPKYSVIEHGTINSVPPLPFCLEGRPNFDCHASPEKVLSETLSVLRK